MKKIICFVIFCFSLVLLRAQQDTIAVKSDSSFIINPLLSNAYPLSGKSFSGKAGAYSSKADGSKTASGEKFSNADFTGACNLFPFNTWIQVVNLANHKSVLVRVNDRTSKKKNAAIVELSRSAVMTLGYLKTGTAKIKIQKIVINNYKSNQKNDLFKINDTINSVSDNLPSDTLVTGKVITGIASFYSSNLDGTKTSTGERYRNNRLTAASNNFKLNTWVRVTNLKNKKTVIVRINDRMHPRMKKKGRVVDLSRDAAKALDFIKDGLTRVKVEPITFGPGQSMISLPADSSLTKADSDSVKPIDTAVSHPDKKDSIATEMPPITGIAVVYNSKSEGNKTASGELYRNNKFSGAINLFPLHTWVRVTNLKNNKKVILKINDRLPIVKSRKDKLIRVSRIAAKRLDFAETGSVKVKVEVVDKTTGQ